MFCVHPAPFLGFAENEDRQGGGYNLKMSLGNKISEVDRRYFPWYPASASEARQDDGYYLKWCWEMRLRKLPVLIFLTVHRCYFRFTNLLYIMPIYGT